MKGSKINHLSYRELVGGAEVSEGVSIGAVQTARWYVSPLLCRHSWRKEICRLEKEKRAEPIHNLWYCTNR